MSYITNLDAATAKKGNVCASAHTAVNEGTQTFHQELNCIVPLYEEHLHTSTGVKKSVVADIYCNGKKVMSKHNFPSGKIENPAYIKRIVGDKYADTLCDKKFFSSVKANYFEQLKKLQDSEIKHIYEKIGFIDDSSVVLGNYLITANEIKPVYIKGNKSLIQNVPITDIRETRAYIEETMLKLTKDSCTSRVWLCFKCLSFIAHMIEPMDVNCNLMLAVIGKTQVKKSSSVKAFFDPQNLPMLRMSFTDTKAAVQRGINNTGGLVAMLDDFAHKKGNGKEMQTLETVIRLTGDSQAGGKMVIGGDINEKTVTPFIVFTGEFLPRLQNSSLARLILTELDKDSVNTDCLTVMQAESERTVAVDVILAQAALNLNYEEKKHLANKFRIIRNELNNSGVMPQARFSDAAAWLLVAAEFLNRIFEDCIIDNALFKKDLCDLFNKQWSDHSDHDIMREYLIKLYNIIELQKFNVVSEMHSPTDVAKTSDSNLVTFTSRYAYMEVVKELKTCGEYNIPTYNAVVKFLKNNKIARCIGNGVTIPKHIGASQPRVITLYWDKLKKILKEDYNYEI